MYLTVFARNRENPHHIESAIICCYKAGYSNVLLVASKTRIIRDQKKCTTLVKIIIHTYKIMNAVFARTKQKMKNERNIGLPGPRW
jgi:hypothetical protein